MLRAPASSPLFLTQVSIIAIFVCHDDFEHAYVQRCHHKHGLIYDSAMLYAQTLPIEQWTASTVDEILAEGDRLYLDALVSRSIPDTETLSLNYMPSVARCCVDSNTNNQYLLAAFHLQFVILV